MQEQQPRNCPDCGSDRYQLEEFIPVCFARIQGGGKARIVSDLDDFNGLPEDVPIEARWYCPECGRYENVVLPPAKCFIVAGEDDNESCLIGVYTDEAKARVAFLQDIQSESGINFKEMSEEELAEFNGENSYWYWSSAEPFDPKTSTRFHTDENSERGYYFVKIDEEPLI